MRRTLAVHECLQLRQRMNTNAEGAADLLSEMGAQKIGIELAMAVVAGAALHCAVVSRALHGMIMVCTYATLCLVSNVLTSEPQPRVAQRLTRRAPPADACTCSCFSTWKCCGDTADSPRWDAARRALVSRAPRWTVG